MALSLILCVCVFLLCDSFDLMLSVTQQISWLLLATAVSRMVSDSRTTIKMQLGVFVYVVVLSAFVYL